MNRPSMSSRIFSRRRCSKWPWPTTAKPPSSKLASTRIRHDDHRRHAAAFSRLQPGAGRVPGKPAHQDHHHQRHLQGLVLQAPGHRPSTGPTIFSKNRWTRRASRTGCWNCSTCPMSDLLPATQAATTQVPVLRYRQDPDARQIGERRKQAERRRHFRRPDQKHRQGARIQDRPERRRRQPKSDVRPRRSAPAPDRADEEGAGSRPAQDEKPDPGKTVIPQPRPTPAAESQESPRLRQPEHRRQPRQPAPDRQEAGPGNPDAQDRGRHRPALRGHPLRARARR